MKRQPEPKWESEAAMLAAFAEIMRAAGFRVVPEDGGHDLLLVAGPDLREPEGSYLHLPDCLEPGDIIAVEGKLRCSVTALRQALPPDRRGAAHHERAADFYVVVVPDADPDYRQVAACVGIRVWEMRAAGFRGWREPRLETMTLCDADRVVGYPRIQPTDLDVGVVAGMPSPERVTDWKRQAVTFCIEHAGRTFTDAAFECSLLRPRLFRDKGWIEVVRREGRAAVYRLTEAPTRPDLRYPELAAAIRARGLPAAPAGPAGPLFERAAS